MEKGDSDDNDEREEGKREIEEVFREGTHLKLLFDVSSFVSSVSLTDRFCVSFSPPFYGVVCVKRNDKIRF